MYNFLPQFQYFKLPEKMQELLVSKWFYVETSTETHLQVEGFLLDLVWSM